MLAIPSRFPGSSIVDTHLDVLARSRAPLDGSDTAAVVMADLRRPGELLASPEVRKLLDPASR
ncbi:MAG: hypothetical protein ACLQDY_13150 [Streptosporangiaceae bacterium]